MSEFRDRIQEVLRKYNTLLLEESPEDENSIEYAKKQVEDWEELIKTREIGDDLYYSNGRYKHDSEQLSYWKNKLKELERASRTPEENARLDAEEKAKREQERADYEKAYAEKMKNLPERFHYSVGDKVQDTDNGDIYVVDEVRKTWDNSLDNYRYSYHITCLDNEARDNYGRKKAYNTGELLHNKRAYIPYTEE